jgi:type I restriction enzyme S subunit
MIDETVPEGFQKTEVGIIPNDWSVKEFEEISDIDSDNLSNSTSPNYEFHYISIEDVDNGILRNKSEMFFKDAPSRARRKIQKGDILLSTVRPNLKSHLLISESVKDWICSTGFSVIRCNNEIVNSGFVFSFLFSSIINKQIDNLISGSNYPAINGKDVKALKIPLPPTKDEQTAIANALNDADELITRLEQLIAKKRLIKQGAMQELLKPKDDWEVKKLGEVFDITAGGDFKKDLSSDTKSEKFPYPIYSNSVTNKGLYGFCNYFSSKSDCITVTARGTIGYANFRNHKFTAIGRLLVLKPKNSVYCFYFSEYINNKIEFVLEVTGVPQLTAPQISQYEVNYPKLKSEQTRIAQILSDMDAEIEALETKLAKYKMLKQGMMQNLLTGKIRLVKNAAARTD